MRLGVESLGHEDLDLTLGIPKHILIHGAFHCLGCVLDPLAAVKDRPQSENAVRPCFVARTGDDGLGPFIRDVPSVPAVMPEWVAAAVYLDKRPRLPRTASRVIVTDPQVFIVPHISPPPSR